VCKGRQKTGSHKTLLKTMRQMIAPGTLKNAWPDPHSIIVFLHAWIFSNP
jgi:hypothetical protein